jgi:protein tyrosine phosphatase
MNFSRLIKNLFLKTGESRLIIHWSEFDWPDHGAPKNPEPFLQLLNDVRHCGAFDPRYGAPILHCSAGKNLFFFISLENTPILSSGIGRSGTFVLVDSILKLVRSKCFKTCQSFFCNFSLLIQQIPVKFL